MEEINNTNDSTTPCLDVAIVGGGIIGVMTALGLVRRGMRVKIYERAPSWHEIGAGFGFTGIARECMQRLDPALLETLSRISQKASSSAHTRYWDAFHPRTKSDAEDEAKSLLFQTPERNLAFWGAVRSHLLLGMAAQLPEGVVVFQKRLLGYQDKPESDRVVLHFADGDVANAHVLIGCDGIHSTTRELLFGLDHPASRPSFSHTVAYRTMVPMMAGIDALGKDKAMSACMHCGPDVNMMSYPVMNGTLLNVAMFAHEPANFPNADGMTAPATRHEIERVVAGLSPQVGEIARLFPDRMVKWGIFDMYEHPAPTFAQGLVCIAGDAAHASSPHQGVGACMGVEDAVVLCEVLDVAQTNLRVSLNLSDELGAQENVTLRRLAVERALHAYSVTRKERSQWLVRSSREMGEMYQWRHGPTGRDSQRCHDKLEQASRKLWDFSVDEMIVDARSKANA
ncbi:putative salicylate hydroxylase [Xylariales sp. AK1849]|nr:putative salicylate hydroxylase [Xylariales sp. AK1849]